MSETIRIEIEKYLKKYPPAQILFEKLVEIGDLYIIGVLLREYKDNNQINSLRDADFSINIKHKEKWKKVIKDIPNQKNRFGGYKFNCSGFIVDVWDVKETWAFRNKIIDVDETEFFKYLSKSVFLNVDALIYDLSNNKWDDAIYLQAMEKNEIDIVLEKNPFIELNLLRSMILKRKYKMDYSKKLANMIYDYSKIDKSFVNKLLDIQDKRYRKIVLTKESVVQEINICGARISV